VGVDNEYAPFERGRSGLLLRSADAPYSPLWPSLGQQPANSSMEAQGDGDPGPDHSTAV
jgi:hypothetical protein